VLDQLPKSEHRSIGEQLRDAYRSRSRATARKRLLQIVGPLENEHPNAAASLNEGLEETLSLKDVGLKVALERALSTTSVLEILNGTVRRVRRNVRSWKDGDMIERRVVAGILEAEERVRKLRGFQELTHFSSHFQSYAELTVSIDNSEAAA
jgi:putative transposase